MAQVETIANEIHSIANEANNKELLITAGFLLMVASIITAGPMMDAWNAIIPIQSNFINSEIAKQPLH